MIVPAAVHIRFAQTEPAPKEVAERASSIISRYVNGTGYAFVRRLKEAASLSEKLESGRYKDWSQLDDLFACAIVVPSLNEEAQVLQFLKAAFREVEIRGRGSAQKDPSTFRFDTTRFIATLRPAIQPEPPDALSRLRFEVQVRTAYEHAWSVATHKLVYKGEHVEWRRLRLLAQLKAASEQLDHLIIGFDTVANLMHDEFWPEVDAKATVEARFRGWVSAGLIPAEVGPASWVRFADNAYSFLRSTDVLRRVDSKLVKEASTFMEAFVVQNSGDSFPVARRRCASAIGGRVNPIDDTCIRSRIGCIPPPANPKPTSRSGQSRIEEDQEAAAQESRSDPEVSAPPLVRPLTGAS